MENSRKEPETPVQKLNFGSLPTKAFDLIFEYINVVDMSHKEILNLRLVNRSFDEEIYEDM